MDFVDLYWRDERRSACAAFRSVMVRPMIRTMPVRGSESCLLCAWLLVLAACTVAPHASSSATEAKLSSGTDGQSVTGHVSATFMVGSTESGPTTGQSSDLPQIDCDFFAQDCPDGHKCVSYGEVDPIFTDTWTGAKCIEIAPNPGQPGDPCTITDRFFSGEDTCDKGATCWFVDDEEVLDGRCVSNCTGSLGDSVCPESGQFCSWISDNDYSPYLCFLACDPLMQDCPGGDLCLPFIYPADTFSCNPPSEGVVVGPLEACDEVAACGPGLVCWTAAAANECDPQGGCCISFCDLTDPICPGQDQICHAWYVPEEAPPEYTTVGLCSLPG